MLTDMVDKAPEGQVFLLSLSFRRWPIPHIPIIYDRRHINSAVCSAFK